MVLMWSIFVEDPVWNLFAWLGVATGSSDGSRGLDDCVVIVESRSVDA